MTTPTGDEIEAFAREMTQGGEVVYVVIGPFDLGVAAVVAAHTEKTFDDSSLQMRPRLALGFEKVSGETT